MGCQDSLFNRKRREKKTLILLMYFTLHSLICYQLPVNLLPREHSGTLTLQEFTRQSLKVGLSAQKEINCTITEELSIHKGCILWGARVVILELSASKTSCFIIIPFSQDVFHLNMEGNFAYYCYRAFGFVVWKYGGNVWQCKLHCRLTRLSKIKVDLCGCRFFESCSLVYVDFNLVCWRISLLIITWDFHWWRWTDS